MRNVETQKKMCLEYLTPENVLAYVLVHEKRTKSQQRYIKYPVTSSVQKPHRTDFKYCRKKSIENLWSLI